MSRVTKSRTNREQEENNATIPSLFIDCLSKVENHVFGKKSAGRVS